LPGPAKKIRPTPGWPFIRLQLFAAITVEELETAKEFRILPFSFVISL
jgi:hypothetical protein